ncbi:MAG: HAMP domain-containing sensor histidine kinase [Candidatus Methanoperedens sp.]|nr:HAMP domain-containing sensor histidine kinase [Candidatus Methanoperedens sp.]
MVKQNLIYRLTLLAIVPVVLSLAVFGSVSYGIFKEKLIQERTEEAKYFTEHFSDDIKNPLYFLELDKLNILVNNLKKNPHVLSVYVMDSNGRVITDGTPENKFYNQTLNDEFSKKCIKCNEMFVEIDNNILHISAPEIITERIGTVRIDFSLKELDIVLANLIAFLAMLGAIILMAAIFIGIYISNSVSKPIINLRDAAGEIARGNLGARMEIKSEDELGELAGAFNTMAEDLQKSIDERKRTEKIRLENERLILANKTKADFLSMMSHELRTPLNGIMGYSQLLKQKMSGDLNEKQEHYVDKVLISGERLLNIIEDILNLTSVEAGNIELFIENISVPDMIDDTISIVKDRAAAHNIVMKKEIDARLDLIEADRLKFKQILFNLLDNAVKFSRGKGGAITITAKKEGDMARFSVSDEGIGIKEEDMGKLFKPFEQVDSGSSRHYGGAGLGLAITKKLVELHGGSITAESRFGEGSTFTFLLPLVQKKVESNNNSIILDKAQVLYHNKLK